MLTWTTRVPRGSAENYMLWPVLDIAVRSADSTLVAQALYGMPSPMITEKMLVRQLAKHFDIFEGLVAKRSELCVLER
jgi:hypothetical protein